MRVMRITALVLTAALFGCGNSAGQASGGDAYGAYVADQFDHDCRREKAPTPKLARDLDQLCKCSTDKLRATVHHGDSDDVVNGKIRQIAEACEKQVYPNG